MGDRYFLEITCPKCKFFDDDAYYAPTCGFTEWKCERCGHIIDLAEFTDISYEEASNLDEIESLLGDCNVPPI
jgi:phage FluMu protein Com